MFQQEKSQLVEICAEIANKRMVTGSGGNVSMKVGNTVLITPSGFALGSLDVQDISELSLGGEYLAGQKPSKETPFHLAIYKALPEIKAIIHVHSFYSVCVGLMAQVSNSNDILPAYTPSFVMKVGRVPLVPFRTPGSLELSQVITTALSEQGSKAILLQNHGLVTVGDNLRDALNIAEEVEESSKYHIVLHGQGKILSASEINEINARYKS
jgi:L-ribulose-5-phosphate 4-epimerase